MNEQNIPRERSCILCGTSLGFFTDNEWAYADPECDVCAYEADRGGELRQIRGAWIPDLE